MKCVWVPCILLALTIGRPLAASDWGYFGDTGPAHWGRLSPDFATCENGTMQSPFIVEPDLIADLEPITFNYRRVALFVINNGHTLQVDTASENHIVVEGTSYELLQFHFHTPSEYVINNTRYPMSAHFVHRSADGKYAVVGVMLEIGAENPAIAQLWKAASDQPGEHSADGLAELSDILPNDRSYLRFMGSLTTPPCTEGINWYLLTTPVTVSRAQVEAFQAIFPLNARPLQPENNRMVVSAR